MSKQSTEVRLVRPYSDLEGKLNPAETTVAFCHVGKTGGSTFRAIMSGVGNEQRAEFREFLGRFDDARNEANSLGNAGKDVRFASGHFPYASVSLNENTHIYVTLVRDPVDRMLSHVRMEEERTGKTITQIPQSTDGPSIIDNFQTRLLSGIGDFSQPCTKSMFDQAIQNLEENLSLVGTTEEFDDFLSCFLSLVNGPSVIYGRRMVSSYRIPEARVKNLKEQVISRDIYDFDLINHIRDRKQSWNAKLLKKKSRSAVPVRTICTIPGFGLDQTGRVIPVADNLNRIIKIPVADEAPLIAVLKNSGYRISFSAEQKI